MRLADEQPRKITLENGETIIAVVPEFCAGPGWSNAVAWVYIASQDRKSLRTECIQPHERSIKLNILFPTAATLHAQLIASVPTRTVKTRKKNA